MVSLTMIFSPWVTVVLALVAASFTVLMAPSMVFSPVPPISVVLIRPFVLVVLPPITALTTSAASNSWLPLMASVEPWAMLPAATPVILLLPLLRPVLVNVTLFSGSAAVMVTPVLLSVVAPVVTLSAVRLSAVPTVIVFPVRAILMFLPSTNLTVSLDLTAVAVSLLAWILNVWLAKLFSWLTFTASLLAVPAATPVNWRSILFLLAKLTLVPPVCAPTVIGAVVFACCTKPAVPSATASAVALTSLMFSTSLLLTEKIWLPLIASVDVADSSPGATFFICRSLPILPTDTWRPASAAVPAKLELPTNAENSTPFTVCFVTLVALPSVILPAPSATEPSLLDVAPTPNAVEATPFACVRVPKDVDRSPNADACTPMAIAPLPVVVP